MATLGFGQSFQEPHDGKGKATNPNLQAMANSIQAIAFFHKSLALSSDHCYFIS
jgi:hypothetical protein